MKSFQRTLVTAALPYANGPVHIGHLAGVYVPADIYVRYLRLKGEPVLYVGGSDEHGVPVAITKSSRIPLRASVSLLMSIHVQPARLTTNLLRISSATYTTMASL